MHACCLLLHLNKRFTVHTAACKRVFEEDVRCSVCSPTSEVKGPKEAMWKEEREWRGNCRWAANYDGEAVQQP